LTPCAHVIPTVVLFAARRMVIQSSVPLVVLNGSVLRRNYLARWESSSASQGIWGQQVRHGRSPQKIDRVFSGSRLRPCLNGACVSTCLAREVRVGAQPGCASLYGTLMCRILMDCTVASTLNAALSIHNDSQFGVHADRRGPNAIQRSLPLHHRPTSRRSDPLPTPMSCPPPVRHGAS